MPDRKTVMISSTARDLPEHREQVRDACLSQDMFPVMMENLPASDADAIAESLAMVDRADIYLGIYAHRYGYVPEGHEIAVTEMEYNRAVERGISRLVFVMHEDHLIRAADKETGTGAESLRRFKDRVLAERVVNFFRSPADLHAQVIDSLSDYRVRQNQDPLAEPDLAAVRDDYFSMLRTDLQYLDLAGLAPRVQNRVVKIRLEDVFIPLKACPEVSRRRGLLPEMLRLLAAGELHSEADLEGRAYLDGELAALVDECPDRSMLAARLAERGYQVPGYDRSPLGEGGRLDIAHLLERKQVVLLGDPGSGKSTTLNIRFDQFLKNRIIRIHSKR